MRRYYYTNYEMQPWADASFYEDRYYEDVPAFLSAAGKAIKAGAGKVKGLFVKKPPTLGERIIGGAKKAGSAIAGGAKKAGSAIASGAKGAGKAVVRGAKGIKNAITRNPMKTAAVVGAGVGAGVLAHQIGKGYMGDSMFRDRITEYSSHPWTDDLWYDSYYLDLLSPNPSLWSRAKSAVSKGIEKAGNAIERGSNKITRGLSKGIEKAGNAIERGSNKITNRLFKKNPAKSKAVTKAVKTESKSLREKAGDFVKNNPGKAAAIAGAAGLGAGIAAGRASKDSRYAMTKHDSMPWARVRDTRAALKRYIDRRVRKMLSRINDLGPGEFDPSIPLYNNRLPHANTGRVMEYGAEKPRPDVSSLANFEKACRRVPLIPKELKQKYGIDTNARPFNDFYKESMKLANVVGDSKNSRGRVIVQGANQLKSILTDIKIRFFHDESHSFVPRNMRLQGKQDINHMIKIIDAVVDLSWKLN